MTPDERRRTRRLGTPKPTSVIPGDGGSPRNIAGRDVDCVREEWVVEDRWWTGRPLRRRYFEVVLLDEADSVRKARLGEAVKQARQAAGADAALRVLDVDPDSRIPERRAVLAPFPDAS